MTLSYILFSISMYCIVIAVMIAIIYSLKYTIDDISYYKDKKRNGDSKKWLLEYRNLIGIQILLTGIAIGFTVMLVKILM